jgi:hypothetical protein
LVIETRLSRLKRAAVDRAYEGLADSTSFPWPLFLSVTGLPEKQCARPALIR